MYVSEVRLVRDIFVRIAASTDCKFCNSTMKNQMNKLSMYKFKELYLGGAWEPATNMTMPASIHKCIACV